MDAANNREKKIGRVLRLTLIVNGALFVLKLLSGILGHSGAMVSDAMHTVSDIGVTLIALAAVRFAGKKRDDGHPYGHEKIESVAGLMLAFILALTAILIGKEGVGALLAGEAAVEKPGLIAFIAAAVSIASQEFLFRIAHRAGKANGSQALIADAWHHRADALSSIGSLAGIGAAIWLGMWYMEPAASLLICLFIVKTALKIGYDSVNQLIDAAPPTAKVEEIRLTALKTEGVDGVDTLRCRLHASRIYVDMELAISGKNTFEDAHGICESVHAAVESEHPEVIHCTVHPNPS